MCSSSKTLKFCTCSEKKEINLALVDEVEKLYQSKVQEAKVALKNGTYTEIYYKWTLQSKTLSMHCRIGMTRGMEYSLSNGLTAEYVLTILNSPNAFDFEYSPSKGDKLIIEACYKYVKLESEPDRPDLYGKDEPLHFTFEEAEWGIGSILGIYKYRTLNKGTVETILITEVGDLVLLSEDGDNSIWRKMIGDTVVLCYGQKEGPSVNQKNFLRAVRAEMKYYKAKIEAQFSYELLHFRILDAFDALKAFKITQVVIHQDFDTKKSWSICLADWEFEFTFLVEDGVINSDFGLIEFKEY